MDYIMFLFVVKLHLWWNSVYAHTNHTDHMELNDLVTSLSVTVTVTVVLGFSLLFCRIILICRDLQKRDDTNEHQTDFVAQKMEEFRIRRRSTASSSAVDRRSTTSERESQDEARGFGEQSTNSEHGSQDEVQGDGEHGVECDKKDDGKTDEVKEGKSKPKKAVEKSEKKVKIGSVAQEEERMAHRSSWRTEEHEENNQKMSPEESE